MSAATATVSYTVPTGATVEKIQDALGNPAANLADHNVTNNTAAPLTPSLSLILSSNTIIENGEPVEIKAYLSHASTEDVTVTVTASASEPEIVPSKREDPKTLKTSELFGNTAFDTKPLHTSPLVSADGNGVLHRSAQAQESITSHPVHADDPRRGIAKLHQSGNFR